MKQDSSTIISPFNLKKSGRYFFWLLLLLTLAAMLLLPSFSNPELSYNSSLLPFSRSTTFAPTTISCKIDNITATGFSSKEASLFKMEQAEGVFAKVLNIKVVSEFVHCKEVQDIMEELAIDYSQGYFFHIPEKL